MKIEPRNNKDFFSGLLFTAVGLAAVVISLRSYHIGTRLNMGPGYFPMLIGSLLAAFGLYIMLNGLIKGEKITGVWALRPLVLVTLAIAAFGFFIDRLGMIPSLVILLFIGALAGKDFRFKEVLVLTVTMIAAAWAIFIYGLNIPFQLFTWEI